jgi:hypothetical protein
VKLQKEREELEQARRRIEERLDWINKAQNYINSLPFEQRLAELIHDKLCHCNHTDGCEWHYQNWDSIDRNSTKYEYLKKAQAMIAIAKDFEVNPIIITKVIEEL